jgi:hypothetical protein
VTDRDFAKRLDLLEGMFQTLCATVKEQADSIATQAETIERLAHCVVIDPVKAARNDGVERRRPPLTLVKG